MKENKGDLALMVLATIAALVLLVALVEIL